jgi:hypothetical protein
VFVFVCVVALFVVVEVFGFAEAVVEKEEKELEGTYMSHHFVLFSFVVLLLLRCRRHVTPARIAPKRVHHTSL